MAIPSEESPPGNQHRQAAHRLRNLASQPGALDPAWAQRIARNHELIADAGGAAATAAVGAVSRYF